jgi:AAT family amino acid transporter
MAQDEQPAGSDHGYIYNHHLVSGLTSNVAATPPSTEEGLQRRLAPRQLTMIAIGSAIGVGLFLGSNVTIRLAGPAVIVTYLAGAVIALIMGYALAEMSVVHPLAGSFGVFAERYLSPWSGFVVRATYGYIQALAIGAEVTAVAIYFGLWFPGVPPWLWVVTTSALLIAINMAQVGWFGELEYWFALIKVVAIVGFIAVGLLLVTGLGPWPATGARNLIDAGGFFPNGWRGIWLALPLVVASFMGVEVIAVTAGEAERPEVSIPRAMRSVVWRLIIFYIVAIGLMLMMTPWNQLASADGGLNGSPFVRAFTSVGLPYAAGIMNLVVISAALSSANSNLYLTTRMLLSLARSGYAPRWLGGVTAKGVPLPAVAASSAGMALAIVLAVYVPQNAFLALYGTAVAGMLFVWMIVLATYLRFRKTLTDVEVAGLPIRMPWHRPTTIMAMAFIVVVLATTFFVDGLRTAVVLFLPFLAVMSLIYRRVNRVAHV